MDPSKLEGGGVVCLLCALCVGFAAGCSKGPSAAPPPADVQVVAVERRDVPIIRDWVGSLDGFVNAQIRAQVSGYLVKQDYKEGTAVRQGDVLFEIDPRPFSAALAQAEGALAQAEAQLGKTELDVASTLPSPATRRSARRNSTTPSRPGLPPGPRSNPPGPALTRQSFSSASPESPLQ